MKNLIIRLFNLFKEKKETDIKIIKRITQEKIVILVIE